MLPVWLCEPRGGGQKMPQYKLPNIDDFAALYAQTGRDPRRFRAPGGPDYGKLEDLRKLEGALLSETMIHSPKRTIQNSSR
jgi:hypothetical protein